MQTFLTPLKKKKKKRKIEFDVADLDTSMIVYKNALALSQESQNVEMVNVYINQSLLAMQYAEQTGLRLDKVLIYFRENLGIPLELAKTEDELVELKEQQLMQQQQQNSNLMQQQQNLLRQQEIDQESAKMALRQQEALM